MSSSSKQKADPPTPRKKAITVCQLIAEWAFDPKIEKIPKNLKEHFKLWNLTVFAEKGLVGRADYRIALDEREDTQNVTLRSFGFMQFQKEIVVTTKPEPVQVVPMIDHTDLQKGGGVLAFSLGSFVTLHLNQPCIIATSQLTGCCLVFGHDKKNQLLYIGHARPARNSQADLFGPRNNLAAYFDKKDIQENVFEGVENKNLSIETYGGNASGYGNADKAQVLGWISDNKFFLLSRVISSDKVEVQKRRIPKKFSLLHR